VGGFANCIGVAKTESAASRCTFGVMPNLHTLTTPIAYITSCPADPFANTKGLVYGYSNMDNQAWKLWSFGPDSDEDWTFNSSYGGGQIGYGSTVAGGAPLPVSVAFNWPASYEPSGAAFKSFGWAWCKGHRDTNGKIYGGWPDGTSTVTGVYNGVYSPSFPTATATLLTGGYTYDSTNGSKSWGDIYRLKQ
jgi:hypothetical protein